MADDDRPRPAVHQSAFLGGEWAGTAQGRIDQPNYKQALNVCLNGLPVAEGAFVRRAGTEFLGPTYGRGTARLLPYRDVGGVSYLVVLTVVSSLGYAHFYSGTAAIYTGTAVSVSTSSSAAGVLTAVLASDPGWVVNDQIKFQGITNTGAGGYVNRVLTITAKAGATLTLKDDLGVAFGFDSTANSLTGAEAVVLTRSTTAFTATTYFDKIRSIQAQTPTGTALFIIERNTAPQVITGTNLAVATASFKDGPYLDPQGGILSPETGTVSAYSGSIDFTPTTTVPVAADVGRHIRLWTQPAAWNVATTYAYGDRVTYNNQFWVSIGQGAYAATNVGIVPGTVPTVGTNSLAVPMWAPDPLAGRWAWGTITAQNGVKYTVSLTTTLNSANGVTVTIWRLGLFKSGQYPACGIFHEGRLWFGGCASGAAAGAPQGRFDASTVDDIYTFSPTDIYGNVADNHAISAVVSSKRSFDGFRWMEAVDTGGILAGTAAGEWLISSTSGDAMTPTTIRATEVTTYGSAEVEPARAGLAIIFVQRFGRTVYEYLADAFSTRFAGRPLNENAKHLAASASVDAAGYYRLAYQSEKTPVIWAIAGGSALFGCTYRRESRFVTEPPTFAGWHRHLLYDGARTPVDICALPGGSSTADLLYIVTLKSTVGVCNYQVEVLRPLLDGEN